MARICDAQNGGAPDLSGWSKRPSWNGIVYFEGNLALEEEKEPHPFSKLGLLVTGHVDLYDGATRDAVHKSYPSATTVWFWKLGA
jgi:hypothetical protein